MFEGRFLSDFTRRVDICSPGYPLRRACSIRKMEMEFYWPLTVCIVFHLLCIGLGVDARIAVDLKSRARDTFRRFIRTR